MSLDDYSTWADELKTKSTTSAAALNLADSVGKNPDEYAERRRLEKATGTPAVLMGDAAVKEDAKKQAYMRGLAFGQYTEVANFASDPINAAMMHDDVEALKDFTDKVKRLPQDTLVHAAKGVVGMGEVAVGLTGLATFGLTGKILSKLGYDPTQTKKILDEFYSDQQKEANKKWEQAEGFAESAVTALTSPSLIYQSIVESLTSMFGGAAVARGLLGIGGQTLAKGVAGPEMPGWLIRKFGPKGIAAAGGIGEGAMQAGSSAEQFRQESPTGLLGPKQMGAAVASGTVDAFISYLGGRVAQKFGFTDADLLLTGKGSSPGARKMVGRRVLEGAASEGILEELPQSAQEQMWQNYGSGKPLF